MSLKRLEGRVAMVTGGGSGIGRAVCHVFARQGARVAILDINRKGAEETLKSMQQCEDQRRCIIEADISKADAVKRAFEMSEKMLGDKCTVLVNCAGILKDWVHLGGLSEKDVDHMIDVNFKGVYLMSKEFVLSLKDIDSEVRGSLINISSINAKTGKNLSSEYAATKAAVDAFTKSISLEFSEHRVRANTIFPGVIDTPMNSGLFGQEWKDTRTKAIPMGRFGRPEEVANACLFLASDESSYVSGAGLDVGGGLAF